MWEATKVIFALFEILATKKKESGINEGNDTAN